MHTICVHPHPPSWTVGACTGLETVGSVMQTTYAVSLLAQSCSLKTTSSVAVHCWGIFQLEPSSVPVTGGTSQLLPPVDLSL